MEGVALSNLGAVFGRLRQHNKEIEFFIKSLKVNISRELGDRAGEGMLLGNLCVALYVFF